jgi:hypothetical protein
MKNPMAMRRTTKRRRSPVMIRQKIIPTLSGNQNRKNPH